MQYTDHQLLATMAKMLPKKLTYYKNPSTRHSTLMWNNTEPRFVEAVKPKELLQICWDLEEALPEAEKISYTKALVASCIVTNEPIKGVMEFSSYINLYIHELRRLAHAPWQQRISTLASILKVEIE